MRLITYALIALTWLSAPLLAQDEEDAGGFLVDLLQDNLSGENRYIKVTGLDGALSSRATIKKLTVSDDEGVWLTITDAVLDWNRLALVRGRFSVNALSAKEIIISRKPGATEAADNLPAPEAAPFQLPELPVSVEIGELHVDRLELAEPVIGKAAELLVDGSLSLADGTLNSKLEITRLDRHTDKLELVAGFQNETSLITLDLTLAETDGGLVSEILSIPDRPSILLTAKGEGMVSDFTADITLATDGTERFGGQVRLFNVNETTDAGETSPPIAFQANLGGDITPLMAAEYRDFFGDETEMRLDGRSYPDGRFLIGRFDILSEALILNGALDIAGSGRLERVILQGRIAPPNGSEVVLPIGEPRTSINSAVISARLEAEKDNTWDLRLGLDGVTRPDMSVRRAQIYADGTLDQADGLLLIGELKAALAGLDFADDNLDRAVGPDIRLEGDFEAADESVLKLRDFVVTGSDYSASLDGEIDGLESGFRVQGRVGVKATDLSRFSGLAGRDVSGSAAVTIAGIGTPLGGTFDFNLNADTVDLTVGIEQADALMTGRTSLVLLAERSEVGLDVRAFHLNGTALKAQASGTLRSDGGNATFDARLDDLARILPKVSGPLTLKGDVVRTETGTTGKVRADGPTGSFAVLDGGITAEGDINVDVDATLARVERFVPEIVGEITANGNAQRVDDTWKVDTKVKGPDSSTADLKGSMTPAGVIDLIFDASLARIERFVPEFPGTITATGTAQRDGGTWTIRSSATGPAGIAAEVAGTVDESTLSSDVKAKGQMQLAAANRFIKPNSVRGTAEFDLALKGPPELNSLSGSITTQNTTVAIPDVAQAIDDLDARVDLSSGRATVSATAAVRAGGQIRINGPVSLTPPYDASIVTEIVQLILTDNVTFESSANGQLTYSGALAGRGNLAGEIRFGETNININSLSGSASAAPIPPIQHRGEPGAVQATRSRAGLIESGNGGAAPDIGLDVSLVAANKVFVRGRGLQAELGGNILVRGTIARVAPSGQINLIRGTLEILGRRLKLTKGLISLQGKLEPYMEFAASTNTSDGDATIEIAGPVSAPEIKVFSEPDRPSEEALAMLVFGNQYSELSPLKIAQMAAALAQLSGAGGGATEKARQGLGVDTFDVGTDESGKAQFGAGKYIADGVYTDVTVNTEGDTEINLNLDVTDSVTLKGTVDRTGDTALGIFFEKDY